jgi:hypothetical protein
VTWEQISTLRRRGPPWSASLRIEIPIMHLPNTSQTLHRCVDLPRPALSTRHQRCSPLCSNSSLLGVQLHPATLLNNYRDWVPCWRRLRWVYWTDSWQYILISVIGGMTACVGNQSASGPLLPPQIPTDQSSEHCNEKPATNYLNYGAADIVRYFCISFPRISFLSMSFHVLLCVI